MKTKDPLLATAGAETDSKNIVSLSAPASAVNRLPLNTTIGTPELCAWQPVAGITWVQARSPQFARKLSQRQDGRLVARGVAGGYLRTFEFRHSLTWARRLIARYTRDGEATNARRTAPARPLGAFSPAARVSTAQARP